MPRHIKRYSFKEFTNDVLQRKEMVTGFDVITKDRIIITVGHQEEGSQHSQGIRLEIWSLTESSQRTTLNLPFDTYKYSMYLHENGGPCVSDENNPHLGLYVHDPTAERIVVLYLISNNGHRSNVLVISVLQILKILASFFHPPGELNWPTWGPHSTRWLNCCTSGALYAYKSMIFLSNQDVSRLSFGTDTILSEYTDEYHTVILDFNQRSIRRYGGNAKQLDMKNTNALDHNTFFDLSSTGTQTKTITHLIEEEWTLHPSPSIEGVKSCLPFSIIIGDPIVREELNGRFFLVSDVGIISCATYVLVSLPPLYAI